MTSAEGLRRTVDDAKRRPTADQIYTRLQSAQAVIGQAAGQCSECGSFRADGRLPILHRDGCSHADDWKADPLGGL